MFMPDINITYNEAVKITISKILDISAKNASDHIGILDEESYRKELWRHKPLTDFWRIGKGISTKLNNLGIYTMGDLCRYSLKNEDRLYKIFGYKS